MVLWQTVPSCQAVAHAPLGGNDSNAGVPPLIARIPTRQSIDRRLHAQRSRFLNSSYDGLWHIAEVRGCYILGPVTAA